MGIKTKNFAKIICVILLALGCISIYLSTKDRNLSVGIFCVIGSIASLMEVLANDIRGRYDK